MQQFRRKPVVVTAVQFTGSNYNEIEEFFGIDDYEIHHISILIHTLEGDMRAHVGDWIIRGVKGEIYPCKPDIFEVTYEKLA